MYEVFVQKSCKKLIFIEIIKNGGISVNKVLNVFLAVLLIFSLVIAIATVNGVQAATPIKVACIGDSITAGAGISDISTKSYPARLQGFLGSGYEVKNFGVNGTTMLKRGDSPYWNTQAYIDSTNYLPDIVVIQLGTNDSKSWNWNSFNGEFVNDYKALIDHYRQLSSHPKVYVNLSPYCYGSNQYEIDQAVIQNQILPKIRQAANEMSPVAPVIDVNSASQGMPEYYPDNVHPNDRGAAVIAEVVANGLGHTKTPVSGMLDRTGWTATASNTNGNEIPGKALDSLVSTRWATGTGQTNGMWFTVDMKASKTFHKVVLDTANFSANDYPAAYQLFVSNDGTNWGSAVATGVGTATSTTISFTDKTARYIKVVQTGTSQSWWSIHDFMVIGDTTGGLVTGQTYKIICKYSGKALDVANWSKEDEANVQQWAYVGGANQKWKLVDAGGGFYNIININSEKGLDVANSSTEDRGNVQQWAVVGAGGDNQQWLVVQVGNYYKIINKNSGKALDVADWSTDDGGNVQQWTYSGGDNQLWSFLAP